jgi:hypothetical protein
MDIHDPTRSVTSSLDGPVLAVLSRTDRPLIAGDIARRAARGSEIGIRRCLARLVDQGIVIATEVGRYRVHELNRMHVAAPIADLLGGLRQELTRRLRHALESWEVPPVYASAFGSPTAGAGGGEPDGDFELLLVHPVFPGEPEPRRGVETESVVPRVVPRETDAARPSRSAIEDPQTTWRAQVDALAGLVHAWTGSSLAVLDLSEFEWDEALSGHSPRNAVIKWDAVDILEIFSPQSAPT